MKKISTLRFCCVLAALTIFTINACAWGQKGHDVTCAIAENHLSGKAKKQIREIFDGKSMVYWANWLDQASHDIPEYRYTSCWHYKNIDEGQTYESVPTPDGGDVIYALTQQIAALKSGKLSKEESALALKVVVHLVGDLHCPMHLARKSDRGGNKVQVQFFGRGTNLHSVFDSGIIERAHAWSYTEWAKQLDTVSPAKAKEIVSGSIDEWGKETSAFAPRIYATTAPGAKLSYAYVMDWTTDIENQLLLGGLRLAFVLNDIFK